MGFGYQLALLPSNGCDVARRQYGRSWPWLQPCMPDAISTMASIRPITDTLAPNNAVRMHGRFRH